MSSNECEVKNNMKNVESGEIDLGKVVSLVWEGKLAIFLVTFLFGLGSIFYVLNLSDIYKSEMLVAPAEQQDASGLSGQLGGLAAIAGVNLSASSSVDKTTLALHILQSREFVSKFIIKHNVLVELMASESWDRQTNIIIIDDELYNAETKTWVRSVRAPKKPEPSMQEAYITFKKMFDAVKDSKSGLIMLEFKHHSPFFAKQMLELILADINDEVKLKDIQEAEKSIRYLEAQITKTNISEVKTTLSSLIEEQTKTLMLANSRDEYMFKIVDPAFVPEEKSEPKRALIVIVATFFGGIFGIIIVLLSPRARRGKADKSLN